MLGDIMFCHSCGAKNPDDSRFCNMCGTPFVRASNPLENTQLGVGGAFAAAAREAVEQERLRESSSSGTHPAESNRPAPLPFAGNASLVDATAPTMVSPSPPPPSSEFRAHLSHPKSALLRPPPTGFDPSVSIRLDAIGIQSARRTWAVLVGGGLVLLALGVGITYVAMRSDEPQGTAHEGDPFEIGTPTADVDFVTGSEDPLRPTTPGAASPTPSPAAATPTPSERSPAAAPSTPGAPNVRAPATAMTPAPAPSTTTVSPAPATPPPPSMTADAPTPAQPATTATEPSAQTAEMELEMYSARVRYLVRRYYAGRAQSCFDQATADNPSLSGQVVVGFHVGADGHVTSARVARNTTGSDSLGSCLARQAEQWSLAPPPSGEVDLSMPFSR